MNTSLNKLKIPALLASLVLGLLFGQPLMAQPGVSVPVDAFYNELAPYGQWTSYPGYGNAWLPNAEPGFQPYATGGHWVMTEYGNTWVSDYDWGWAPFHYGRWIYDPAYGGWLWLPDTEWAPAWVSWRSGGGYYGWAPLGPGVNININIPAPYWTFVPQVYITSPNLYGYYVPRNRIGNIYQHTTYINNVYRVNNRAFNYGPPRGDIERATRRNVQVYQIESINRPGRSVVGNGSVGFYRPNQGSGYGQGYNNRADRYDNAGRPDYNRNNGVNQGNYGGYTNGSGRGSYDNRTGAPNGNYNGNATPNRDYGNRTAPGRTYDGTPNRDIPTPGRRYDGSATGRGSYGGNAPANQPGSYGTTPVPDNAPSNRFERSRGSYSPGSIQQQQQAPGPAPQGQMPAPSLSGGRSGSDGQRGADVRSTPVQAQPQQQAQPGGGGERRGRGPR